jgi:uncharacterized membrane protein
MASVVLGISRFFHIGAGCFIIGNSFSDVIWGSRSKGLAYLITFLTCYVFLLVSGVISMIFLRPSKRFQKYDQKVWASLMYLKFVVWILFIPIPDWIAESVGGSFPRVQFNAALIFVILIVSVSAKQFREKNSKEQENLLS